MEKWVIRKGSLIEVVSNQWTCDIVDINVHFEIVTVWGSTKEECLSRANRICKVNEMEAALREVIKPHNKIDFILKINIESLLNDLKP